MYTNDLIDQAADLAERIVEEVAAAERDWGRIAAWARQLAELSDGAASADADT